MYVCVYECRPVYVHIRIHTHALTHTQCFLVTVGTGTGYWKVLMVTH
jgi:hypothetical protein